MQKTGYGNLTICEYFETTRKSPFLPHSGPFEPLFKGHSRLPRRTPRQGPAGRLARFDTLLSNGYNNAKLLCNVRESLLN